MTTKTGRGKAPTGRADAARPRVLWGTVTFASERDERRTVSIVGVDEADMADGTISIGSPMALAVLNARAGDKVMVRSPRATQVVEALEIRDPAPPG